jgi:hypothetical protein
MSCGRVINPGQKIAQTKELFPSPQAQMRLLFCEECGKEKEKKMAVTWDVLDEERKVLGLESYWQSIASSG